MSSESSIKTISIDPELFSLPGTKKTKKKSQIPKPKSTSKGDAKRKKDRIKEFRKSFMQKLEMTQPNKSNPNSSLSSNSSKPETSSPDVLLGGIPNEFSNSLEYMQNRYEKNKNTTNTNIPPTEINKEPDLQTNSIIPTDSKPVPYMLQSSSVVPTPTQSVSSSDTTSDIPSDTSSNTSLILPDKPWGNLKGGNKLTYRNWKTKTQKASTNNPEHQVQVQVQHTANSKDNYIEPSSIVPPASTSITTSNIQKPLKISSITKKEHDTPTLSSETSVSVPVKKRITKTKTSKTYKLGRSLKTRKISVLLKNKTVKNKIIVAKNRLKHVSLVDIKLYLKKHNLIKSGMSTPHSLLRHMYESAIMSGEVFNNNDDMVIHNFNNPE
jgi:hypothetical protein